MLPSSSPSAAMPARLAHRHGLDRVVVEHEAQRVGVVDGDVEDHAAAGLGRGDPPALQVRRQVDGVEHPREQRAADPAGLDRVAHGAVGGGVAQMMVGAHHHAGLAAGRDHLAGVGHASCASGFSHRTCLPAAAAARVCALCSSLVVLM